MKTHPSLALAFALVLCVLVACAAPAATPLPPAQPPASALPPAAEDPIVLANAFVAAMNRGALDEALAMFTDDAEYAVAVQASKGKEQSVPSSSTWMASECE